MVIKVDVQVVHSPASVLSDLHLSQPEIVEQALQREVAVTKK